MRLVVEASGDTGAPSGWIAESSGHRRAFCGWLEFVAAVEAHLLAEPSPRLPDDQGLIHAQGRDATTIDRAQAAVARQAALLELAHDAIIVLDNDCHIVFWNHGAEETYGYSVDEALGELSYELLHTQFPEPLDDLRARIVADGGWQGELVQRRRDGRRIVVSSRWAFEPGEGGDPIRFLEINRDVTGRRQAEERLAAQAAELARSNADLEQFAYVASHDLADPLAVITSYAVLLVDCHGERLGPEAQGFVSHILESAERLRALIDDLLSYARLGREAPVVEPVDLAQLLADVVADLATRVGETGATITWGALPTLEGDRAQLAHLLRNLLANALTFSRPGARPRVRVAAQAHDEGWLVSVTDNGIGIGAADRERIFGMFERLHRHQDYPGAGIGLAICRRVVERHGGSIWIEEAPGGGSRFCFTVRSEGPADDRRS